jgi:RND family efflux transporter MFP subunit
MARISSCTIILSALCTWPLVGCQDQPLPQSTLGQSRPVTVLELTERTFAHESNLTGSVSLYREEQLGFEVSGRILSVREFGRQVIGPTLDEKSNLVIRGDIIGEIDDTRYRLQVEAAKARLDSAKLNLGSINAELDRSLSTLNRQKRLLEGGAGSQQAVDDATGDYRSLLAKQGQQKAQIKEIAEQLNKAEEDLEDCKLYAPFSGRITRIHVSQGAVIDTGTPVVTLTLMDPIQIQVAVSADHDRKIQTGDLAFVFPKDPVASKVERLEIPAMVFEKGSVADPGTHTFRIDLMVRNKRLRIDHFDPETVGLPLVTDYLPTVRRNQGDDEPLFIPANSIYQDRGKDYVLRLPGVSFNAESKRGAIGKHVPEKVEVNVGDEYLTVVRWTFRKLSEPGDLSEGEFLIVNPKPAHESGLAIGRPQWLFRPGDLIPVRFLLDTAPRGFYVPVNAITTVADEYQVFVVEDGVAHARAVSVHESYQELRRIEGEGIRADTLIIIGGVHYVSDGEPVSITTRVTDLQ